MRKNATLILIAVLSLCSLVMVGSVFAESTPKPSVPEFTVELGDSSYDVPTTYSIDPYTGENVTHEGYHVESRTIKFEIKNQPFTPYTIEDSAGNSWTIAFYYNIRFKGHFEEDWTKMFLASDGYPHQHYQSDYTVFSYQGEYSITEGLEFEAGSISTRFPVDAEIDFQVEAMIGYVHRDESISTWAPWVLEGEKSGWSNTQTIKIEELQTPAPTQSSSPEPTPSPYNEPQSTEQEVILGATITATASAVGLSLIVYLIKRK
jgi:hypothetical protein